MKINMRKFLDQKMFTNALVFFSGTFLVFAVWFLFNKVFLPENIEINSQALNLAKEINLQLNSAAIDVIQAKHSFPQSQLTNFQIYLLNNKVNYNTGEISIKYFSPVTPPDLAYSTLVEKKLIDNN